MKQELCWLYELKDEVKTFLSHQKSSVKKGYYHYIYSGDIYDERIHWNVGSSVFASKLYYFLGIEKNQDIIDTCLKVTNDLDACDNFNIILVLNYASKQLQRNYRQKEIENFALNRLQKYKVHYKKEQGGFSFFLNGANTRYYGAKTTKGFNEADIHGTFLFMCGIFIIIQILRLEKEFDFREFLT